MEWIDEAQRIMGKGAFELCQKGCNEHTFPLEPLKSDLSHHLKDWPDAKQRVNMEFFYPLGDAVEYGEIGLGIDVDKPGYCPGHSTIPSSIQINGSWEGFDTALVVAILDGSPGMVLDFGANIGWYTILAAKLGYEVVTVEGDLVIAKALQRNIEHNQVSEKVHLIEGFIDTKTRSLPPGEHIRLIKADVEGSEGEVLRVCHRLFNAGLVDYALLELTPVFASTWEFVVEQLNIVMDMGYRLYEVPDKGFNVNLFTQDPLGATEMQQLHSPSDVSGHQIMGLLKRV